MRLFWNTIYALIIAVVVAVFWQDIQQHFIVDASKLDRQRESSFRGNAKLNLAYQLDQQRWTDFSLNPGDTRLKLVSNAEISKTQKITHDDRWFYAMEYQVLDADDQVLIKGEVHHKTGQNIFLDQKNNEQYVAASYYESTLNPLDGRLHLLNLRGFNGASKIRLRLLSLQAPIKGVIARVYRPTAITADKLSYQWQRLAQERKKNLARSSVYQQQQLLRESEKNQLLNNLWSPMGPLGINEIDYKTKKVYVSRPVEEDTIVNLSPVDPIGLVVYPDRFGVVKIPVFSGKVKISWQAIESNVAITANQTLTNENENENETDQVKIQWWGHPSTRQKTWNIAANKGEMVESIESGVIQLSATRATVFRLWTNTETKPVEITPDTAKLRLFRATSDPVIYDINHLQQQSTPFKLQLRRFIDQGLSNVWYRFYDHDNQLVDQGNLITNDEVSHYDMVTVDQHRVISNPQNYFFNLPPNIDRVEIYSDSEVWLAAYTRPYNLPLAIDYPFKQENAAEQRKNIPAWYFLRPSGWRSYIAKGGSTLLSLQLRPPEIDQMLMTGQYRWDQFLPNGQWRGRQLLTQQYEDSTESSEFNSQDNAANTISNDKKNNDKKNSDKQSTIGRYQRLTDNADFELDFKVLHGEQAIAPRVIYLQPEAKELTIKLWLNNKLVLNKKVYANSGELKLGLIEPGQYRAKLQLAKDAELYIEQQGYIDTPYIKRTAIQLNQQPLQFSYYKEYDQELIAIRVYNLQSENADQKIKLSIEPIDERSIGPFDSWSITQRNYHLKQSDGLSAKLLGTRQQNLAPPKLLFVSLGKDLANHKTYQIQLSLTQGSSGYIILSRTLPGLFDKRVIKNEKVFQ